MAQISNIKRLRMIESTVSDYEILPAGPPRSIRGDTVSTNTLNGRSSSVMDKVSPTMSVTCTLKFAYSSLCVDGTITVDLKSRPSMIVVAFNPDSRIETLLEASVLFTVNSMLRLSPAFAYTGFGLLVIIERGGEDNLMIWTPLL